MHIKEEGDEKGVDGVLSSARPFVVLLDERPRFRFVKAEVALAGANVQHSLVKFRILLHFLASILKTDQE